MRKGCQERLGLKHKADVLMFENSSQILTQYFLLTPPLELPLLKWQPFMYAAIVWLLVQLRSGKSNCSFFGILGLNCSPVLPLSEFYSLCVAGAGSLCVLRSIQVQITTSGNHEE